MFRAATRALPATRAVLQRRTMASAAKPNPEAGFWKTWVVGMPVDVYPLAGIVTVACSGSFYMIYKHLTEDSARGELRLLPTSMRQ
ncbi:hypothetical protein CC85DRAFT_299599 [Cutaneotrichosporon oleaginosum]|uniref:Uncharacterized protein n=1 Tax=Cutaneotrichosporon oleaginosum TaxID=879819 RepID=A0A0J0XWU9_9TREE|nr:uncharacterized protein CC85DRAFT_299599 [Cutaneotrichosporon oleaginosum]KLT45540.1 hypothetical protein CC85DRAFT_299599 [Cutaneotrichosporon oleaginosum]TXT14506.1 hypothetical protein COLE_00699 [Cutaneotrichosporon oleaginosum]